MPAALTILALSNPPDEAMIAALTILAALTLLVATDDQGGE